MEWRTFAWQPNMSFTLIYFTFSFFFTWTQRNTHTNFFIFFYFDFTLSVSSIECMYCTLELCVVRTVNIIIRAHIYKMSIIESIYLIFFCFSFFFVYVGCYFASAVSKSCWWSLIVVWKVPMFFFCFCFLQWFYGILLRVVDSLWYRFFIVH